MKRLQNHYIGVDQGSVVLFSDFENGGTMWTGNGPRLARKRVTFAERFRSPPLVHLGIAMWDMDQNAGQRADLKSEQVTEEGFDIVFRTWGDTRVARVRADWLALGELRQADEWDLY